MLYTQDDKLISVETQLGTDMLLLTGLTGEEAISRIFSFELRMLSENHAIAFESIIGTNVTVTIGLADGSSRYLNGIISTFSQGRGAGEEGGDPGLTHYRATMVPWFWVLTKATDSRIFQNLSVIDIVEQIFKEQGFSYYRLELHENYRKREFCVQYRETVFAFVSRLLEEEGIFYFFEHLKGKHIMVLADDRESHKPLPGQQGVACRLSGHGVSDEDAITAFELTRQIPPSSYSLTDFNFKIPNTDLTVEIQGRDKSMIGDRRVYDHPGNFDNRSTGDFLAKIRIEEAEADAIRIFGSSDCRFFASGYRFSLREHPRADLNEKEYVLVSVLHKASEGYGDEGGAIYQNSFRCLPYSVPYRPCRLTARPVVQGTQTAVVVGPPGEEIHTDEFGRVKVQFHWDREKKKNDNSSCWIRVSQACAANGWGTMTLPRVGQEVLVDFLEGDPDRPIIIGQLYNGVNLPPYALPSNKATSTMKTNSYPGGDGFNEIRFDDRKGQEQLFLHAERQKDLRVKGDCLEWVGQDRHVVVVRNRYEKVSGDQHLTVAGDRREMVQGTASLNVGADWQQKTGGKHALYAGEEIHLKAGSRVVIESGRQISLKVGGNFINIGPAGVDIVGTMVLINSGGNAGFGSGARPDPPKIPLEAARGDAGKPDSAGATGPANPDPQVTALKTASREHKTHCGV